MATFNDIIGCTLKIDNQKSKINSDKKNNIANSELILEGGNINNANLNGNTNSNVIQDIVKKLPITIFFSFEATFSIISPIKTCF